MTGAQIYILAVACLFTFSACKRLMAIARNQTYTYQGTPVRRGVLIGWFGWEAGLGVWGWIVLLS